MPSPGDIPPEELARYQRYVNRTLFQYHQDLLLAGSMAARMQNLTNWFPLVRLAQDDGNAGETNVPESRAGQRIN